VVRVQLGADDYVVNRSRRASCPEGAGDPQAGREGGAASGSCTSLWSSTPAPPRPVKGKEITLTATEFSCCTGCAAAGRAFSRDSPRGLGYGGEIETRTVDTHMKRLRAKLGRTGTGSRRCAASDTASGRPASRPRTDRRTSPENPASSDPLVRPCGSGSPPSWRDSPRSGGRPQRQRTRGLR